MLTESDVGTGSDADRVPGVFGEIILCRSHRGAQPLVLFNKDVSVL